MARKIRRRKVYTYTDDDISRVTGLSLNAIRVARHRGKFNKSFESMVAFVLSTIDYYDLIADRR
jgi:hypothetical protein